MQPSDLVEARKTLHITQAEMADRMGISRHTYMRWESGATKRLPADLSSRVALCIAGKTAVELDRGEDMIEVNYKTYRKWYNKVGSKAYQPNEMHPTGHTGRIKRRYLEAYERGDMTTWGQRAEEEAAKAKAEWLAKDEADNAAYLAKITASIPTLEEALGHYETTGEDDAETEKRINNFFA